MSNAVAAEKATSGVLAVGGRWPLLPFVCLGVGALVLALPTLLFVARES